MRLDTVVYSLTLGESIAQAFAQNGGTSPLVIHDEEQPVLLNIYGRDFRMTGAEYLNAVAELRLLGKI